MLSACGVGVLTSGRILVVGAETQYGDVLQQIGGRYVTVVDVVDNPNTDPHNVEASPRVAQELALARLVVQNGDGYDAFLTSLESATSSPSRHVLSVAVLTGQTHAANPHLWWDPTTIATLASRVSTLLSQIDPAHADYYRANALRFASSWAKVEGTIAAARVRLSGRAVATTEPVGDDLLRALGVTNLTPWRFQDDVMNGVDPSPEDVATEEGLLSGHRVGALVYNSQVTSPVTSAVRALAAREHVTLVPIFEIMSHSTHVQQWYLDEVRALELALERGGPS